MSIDTTFCISLLGTNRNRENRQHTYDQNSICNKISHDGTSRE